MSPTTQPRADVDVPTSPPERGRAAGHRGDTRTAAAKRHARLLAVRPCVLPREVVIVLTGVLVYFGVRGWTHSNVDRATGNAHLLLRLERSVGLHIEPWMQEPVRDSRILTTIMNWIYIWGHWPVIVATLLWLVMQHPRSYRLTRNAMLISGAVGLVVFTCFPVAPPRLADPGLVDTITKYSDSYRVLQPPAFVNQYAAMPSLHAGWDLLIGIAIAANARWLWLRLVGVLLPLPMAVAVITTANHYVVDVVAGVALVLVSLFAASRLPSAAPPGGNVRRSEVDRCSGTRRQLAPGHLERPQADPERLLVTRPRPDVQLVEPVGVGALVDDRRGPLHQDAPAGLAVGVEAIDLERHDPRLLRHLQLRPPRRAEDHVETVDTMIDREHDRLTVVDERQPTQRRGTQPAHALVQAEHP
jgi:hypothetical protein